MAAVHVLGGLSASRDGVPLDGPWLHQRPGDLLALLVAERERALAAEEIAETLWPDRGIAALGTVHHFVSVLRDRLEPGRARGDAGAAIETLGRAYRLGESVVVDADRFISHAVAGLHAWREQNAERALRELLRADALYRGPFLGERDGPWIVLLERERLRALAADAWRALIQLAQRRGDAAAAARHRARLAAQEPWDDDVQHPPQRDQTRPSDVSQPANGEQIDAS
ncbi:MAG TPA: BTAD domain-containing putative transcriptional regulator [Conexibacter sp.]|nr:BTAD domain-containing putative transcriptional regulator [Conexibacter sp.]